MRRRRGQAGAGQVGGGEGAGQQVRRQCREGEGRQGQEQADHGLPLNPIYSLQSTRIMSRSHLLQRFADEIVLLD